MNRLGSLPEFYKLKPARVSRASTITLDYYVRERKIKAHHGARGNVRVSERRAGGGDGGVTENDKRGRAGFV